MKKQYIYHLLFFFLTVSIVAQQTPAPKQSTAYSIEGATAHIGNGQVVENALIIFDKGKIAFIGNANTKIARKGTIINAKGKHVYPGFIVANTSLGLAEIDAVKATRDFQETGSMLPHIRSLIAYNAESKVVESMRPNGVLIAQVTPRGATISGTSSIVQLDAWNWEDAALKTDDGIHINWPGSFKRGRWWLGEDPALKPDPKYAENKQSVSDFFTNAKLYLAGNRKQKHLPYAATKGLFNGNQQLFIHVNRQREIADAVNMFKELGIKKMVIVRGNEAHKVADLLVKNNIPVILDRPHRVPANEDDDYDFLIEMLKYW